MQESFGQPSTPETPFSRDEARRFVNSKIDELLSQVRESKKPLSQSARHQLNIVAMATEAIQDGKREGEEEIKVVH